MKIQKNDYRWKELIDLVENNSGNLTGLQYHKLYVQIEKLLLSIKIHCIKNRPAGEPGGKGRKNEKRKIEKRSLHHEQ